MKNPQKLLKLEIWAEQVQNNIFNIKIELGIFEISNVPNFNKF